MSLRRPELQSKTPSHGNRGGEGEREGEGKEDLGKMRPCGLQDKECLVLSCCSLLVTPSVCVPIPLSSPFPSIPLSEILAFLLF